MKRIILNYLHGPEVSIELIRIVSRSGLFYFDGRFRPVPLATTFVGVKALNSMAQMTDMNNICYDKAVDFVKKGHQVRTT